MLPPPVSRRRESWIPRALRTFCSYLYNGTENIMHRLLRHCARSLKDHALLTLQILHLVEHLQQKSTPPMSWIPEQHCYKGFSYPAQKSVPWNDYYLLIPELETTGNIANALSHECVSDWKIAIRSFLVFFLWENRDQFFLPSFILHIPQPRVSLLSWLYSFWTSSRLLISLQNSGT